MQEVTVKNDWQRMNMEECGYPYKITVIMSVYNVELYINEAVDSVLKQDIGFQRNVQIVFVVDGSEDRSGEICEEYMSQYPDNIVVIYQENRGLSGARNTGIQYAQGRYVNYFDPDDRLSRSALRKVYTFFDRYHDDVEVVSIPLMFFDGMSGPHPLNNKFKKGNRIIDLQRDYQMIQLSSASAFYKLETMQHVTFDETIVTGEDAKENIKLLLKNYNLGVVKNCTYFYRKRIVGQASICQDASLQAAWYLSYLRDYSLNVIAYCKAEAGFVPKFVQYTIMYDLQWKLQRKEIPNGLLTEDETREFFVLLKQILQDIDDVIILEQKNIYYEHKLFVLWVKYGTEPRRRYRNTDMALYYGNTNVGWLSERYLKVDLIHINNGSLILSGYTMVPPLEVAGDITVSIQDGEKTYLCESVDRHNIDVYSLNMLIFKSVGFQCTLPLNDDMHKFIFVVSIDGHPIHKRNLRFGNFSPISTKYHSAYYWKDGYMLTVNHSALYAQRSGQRACIKRELKFLKELIRSKKKENLKAAAARTLVHLVRPFMKKKVWLVSDKADRADDNGEAFFMYLQALKTSEIKAYFVIGKSSHDYERMKRIGKVVGHMSWKHKFLHLLSNKVISAYSHMEIANPFQNFMEPYRDLMNETDLVFLQHGIIKDDISRGLNKYHKNYKMFVTSTQREHDSILEYEYGYTPDEVVLTGLPRYDRLYDDRKKKITIMPTWRRSLFSSMDAATDIWRLRPGFEQSEYMTFYNQLINNRRLIEAAEAKGYRIQFLPHPTLFPYLSYFHPDERVTLLNGKTVYRTVFAESDLIVTDYSSVAFDFAYLNKPVVYAHFDRSFFWGGGHDYTEGYFNYEEDGFGEVEYDLESLVDRLIEYMENDCRIKPAYQKRVEQFFTYRDDQNCERVYQAICALDLRKGKQ